MPLYWKMADGVPDLDILTYRVSWSFVFIIILIFMFGKQKTVLTEPKHVLKRGKTTIAISIAAVLITANWFIYIFAVNSNDIISASLGYYTNPSFNVLLALLFLKERLSVGETSRS